MAGLYNEWAFRPERVIRDRNNPLDSYNDEELIEVFRFCRRDLFGCIEELQVVADHNAGLSPALQLLLTAFCFYANGASQNTFWNRVSVHKSTACRAITGLLWYARLPTEGRVGGDQTAILPDLQNSWYCGQALLGQEYLYVNCKGYHFINIQIACNANYNIFNLVARWPGSTHDARILQESALHQDFEAGRINGLRLGDWLPIETLADDTDNHSKDRSRTAVWHYPQLLPPKLVFTQMCKHGAYITWKMQDEAK